jgi:hypothetical protein
VSQSPKWFLTNLKPSAEILLPTLHSLRRVILVAAIETRSLPRFLAAAHRGFAFYLADSLGSIAAIAKAVQVNRPYLKLNRAVKVRTPFRERATARQRIEDTAVHLL